LSSLLARKAAGDSLCFLCSLIRLAVRTRSGGGLSDVSQGKLARGINGGHRDQAGGDRSAAPLAHEPDAAKVRLTPRRAVRERQRGSSIGVRGMPDGIEACASTNARAMGRAAQAVPRSGMSDASEPEAARSSQCETRPKLREPFGLKLAPLRGLLEMADINVLT
jgi:hypothetical protein